ncbi:BMP family ABC transporter substrate-binding protein [Pelagibius sp.]|uniref:BMP family lipoprotein n=1 Tax=Pelagibius sp. TaxID=1931238 RepID=UPI002AC31656|nr:BMP family ABC transporter substrate-binding protein [Pelagibius sp.]
MLRRIPLLAVLLCALTSAAVANEAGPAVVYSVGGKFDGSFNEAAYRGAERYRAETGERYAEFEIASAAQSLQALRSFAQRGHSPVVAIGFTHAAALADVAPEFPETAFVLVDMVVEAPNVRSVVFREQEGSYVVGRLAAMASKTGTLGFVGGMDIPIIRKFACGYIQGARSADPAVKVLVNMTGNTPAAWSNPARGAELTRSQIEQGADVIIQAAGGTGIGVLQAAADGGALGIGTDSNQNGLHPGKVLTSMRKRVDVAVYENFLAAREGRWTPGVQVLGLAEGGLDWVIDAHNRGLITAEMEAAAEAAAAGIAEGRIKVHDAASEGPCPVK